MGIDFIVNELSFSSTAGDIPTARERVTSLVKMLAIAKHKSILDVLRVPEDFYVAQLASGYCIANWLADKSVDDVERQLLRRLSTKCPFWNDLQDARKESLSYDFHVDGDKAQGCGVAYLLQGMCVSIQSDPRWNNEYLELSVERLDDHGIKVETTNLVHADREEHLSAHSDWLASRMTEGLKSGSDYWELHRKLFPSLQFCDTAVKQLNALSKGAVMLQPVINALTALEKYCKTWVSGGFEPTQIPLTISKESGPTMDEFGSFRQFKCPDGEIRTFEWHVKIGLNSWRVHFYFDNATSSQITIGYIGEHLPTVKYRT